MDRTRCTKGPRTPVSGAFSPPDLDATVGEKTLPDSGSDQVLAAGEKIPGGDEKRIPGGLGILISMMRGEKIPGMSEGAKER